MKQLAFILLFSLFFFTCKKKESINPVDDLPPETQTGQQSFGCVVNGKAWVPSAPFPLNRLTVGYYQGGFSIRATLKTDSRYQTIAISKDHVTKPGIFILNKSEISTNVRLYDYKTSCTYQTDSVNVGLLEMTRVDTINGIFSGRFSFKIGADGCDTIRVTSGRFDVRR